jgi:hypothetical protein
MVEPMHGTGRIAPAALLLLGALGCGGGDGATVDASGDYTLAVTNGDNECGFEGWDEGEQSSGVPFNVNQDDDGNLDASLEGWAGAWVSLVLGANDFEGEVSGSRLELTLYGTRSFNDGGCTFTVNGEVLATLNDDALEGTISYRPQTNGSPDCDELNDCASVQDFNGTRPPQ